MNEHEQLKIICDKIWYKYSKYRGCGDYKMRDIREIIFTQEFIEKFEDYIFNNEKYPGMWENNILKHLENPVEYLNNSIQGIKK